MSPQASAILGDVSRSEENSDTTGFCFPRWSQVPSESRIPWYLRDSEWYPQWSECYSTTVTLSWSLLQPFPGGHTGIGAPPSPARNWNWSLLQPFPGGHTGIGAPPSPARN